MFEEWKATKRPCADLGAEYSDESLKGQSGLVYSPGYIEITGGTPAYRLIIDRSEWIDDDLEKLERILWDEFVLDELMAEES